MRTASSSLLCLLLLCGCAIKPAQLSYADPAPLVPGDSLRVDLVRRRDQVVLTNASVMVIDSKGEVAPPLLDTVQVRGLTLKEAERCIQNEYDRCLIEWPFDVVLSRSP